MLCEMGSWLASQLVIDFKCEQESRDSELLFTFLVYEVVSCTWYNLLLMHEAITYEQNFLYVGF